MTHEDAGHYRAKHPGGKINTAIADAIRSEEEAGCISCAAAHAIAEAQGCSPHMVGMNIDLLERRIAVCQLGLFGHGDKPGKAVEAASTVPPELETAIREAMHDERITCRAAWDVADRFQLSRMTVACACEALAIKVSACQLGAF